MGIPETMLLFIQMVAQDLRVPHGEVINIHVKVMVLVKREAELDIKPVVLVLSIIQSPQKTMANVQQRPVLLPPTTLIPM